MNRNRFPGFAALLVILLVAVLVLTSFHQPDVSAQQTHTAQTQPQVVTPTPPAQDASEIGSTDSIMLMGVVITLIAILPLLFRKRET
jgi:hypothetical protein